MTVQRARIFQNANILRFGAESVGSVATGGAGTSVRYYPPLFQPVTMIRFGFKPQGNVAGGGGGGGVVQIRFRRGYKYRAIFTH